MVTRSRNDRGRSASVGRSDRGSRAKNERGRSDDRYGRKSSPRDRGNDRDRKSSRDRGRDSSRDRKSSRGRRDKSRDGSRERGRGTKGGDLLDRKSSRGRDRSGSRDKRRGRDSSRSKSRGRDNSRDRSRGRDKSKDRGRNRSEDGKDTRRGRDRSDDSEKRKGSRGKSRDGSRDRKSSRGRDRSNDSRKGGRGRDRSGSRDRSRGKSRAPKLEDLTDKQLVKWFKEIGLSKDNVYDLEDARLSARDLMKASERDLEKYLKKDRKAAQKLADHRDNPKKDHLLAATGKGGDKVDDEDYIGKTVEVKYRGRRRKAVVKRIKGDEWEVEIDEGRKYPTVETFSRRELDLPEVSMDPGHRVGKIAKGKDKVGMKVKVKGRRRGETEKGEIERDNRDGTFDVYMIDDRSVKKGVDERDIEWPEGESDGELRCEVYDRKYDEKVKGVVVEKGKGEYKVKLDSGKTKWVNEEDVTLKANKSDGKGGELFDIEIDIREAEKLNVTRDFIIEITCGKQKKEIKGKARERDPTKIDDPVTFKGVNPDEARTIKIEVLKPGRVYGVTPVGSGEIDLRDVCESSKEKSKDKSKDKSKEKTLKLEDRGKSAGKIWYKTKAKFLSKAGGGRTSAKVGGGMVTGEKWNGVRPQAIFEVNRTTVAVCDGELVDYEGDAIVNVTDEDNRGKSGLREDEDLTKAGGRDFEDSRRDMRRLKIGSAKACKPGGSIRCGKWVILTALQKFGRNTDRDLEDVQDAWRNIFKEAADKKVKSLAIGLIPPAEWQGRDVRVDKVIRTGLKELKHALEGRDNDLTEVCLVASGGDLKDLEDEVSHELKDFAKKDKSLKTLETMADIFDYADDNRNGTLDRREFEDLMDKVGLSVKEAGVLFDYYDRDGDGTMSLDEFRHIESEALENHKRNPGDRAPPSKTAKLEKWAEELTEKVYRIIDEYKQFRDKKVQARYKTEKDWLDATILEVNKDGTFEVEFRDRSIGEWRACPRHQIRLPVVTKSKVKMEITKARGFPAGKTGFLRRGSTKGKHYVNVQTRNVDSLAKTEAVSGSSPEFRDKISFTCMRREFEKLKLVVKDDRGKDVADGNLIMDGDRWERGFTENVRCEGLGGSRDRPEFDVTVSVETSISVLDAFKDMDDRHDGKISLDSLLDFTKKYGIKVKEDDVEDLFKAIDQDKKRYIKRTTFCGFAGASATKDFAEALKQACNKLRGGGSGGGGKCKVKLTVIELDGVKDREVVVTARMGSEKFKTKPSKSRGRCEWEETFSMTCPSGDFDKIEFEVDEDDRGRRGKSIGTGKLSMEGKRGDNLWKDLEGDRKGKTGEVEISRDVYLKYKLVIESEEESSGGGGEGEDISKWSERDVEDWLEKNKWGDYIRDFKGVNGADLLELRKRDLEDKKVSKRDVNDILDAIDDLKKKGGSKKGGGKDLADMNEDDIIKALGKLGNRYSREIQKKRWDGRAFKKLRERDLEDARIDRRDARAIMEAIEKIKDGGGKDSRDKRDSSRDRGRDSSRDRGRDSSRDSRDKRDSSKDRGRDGSRERGGRRSTRDKSRDGSRDGRRSTRNDRDGSRERGGRSSTRNRSTREKSEPSGSLEITFQFGVSNPNSTRVMACKENETALEVCEKIHTKYLASVQANEMELVFNEKAMDPKKKLHEIGVRDKDRIVIRRLSKKG